VAGGVGGWVERSFVVRAAGKARRDDPSTTWLGAPACDSVERAPRCPRARTHARTHTHTAVCIPLAETLIRASPDVGLIAPRLTLDRIQGMREFGGGPRRLLSVWVGGMGETAVARCEQSPSN
jgi:hypothetical protein